MRVYLHPSDIAFDFTQTKEDFFVEEIPNRVFTNKGKYLILKVQKQELTTWDMVAAFARALNIDAKTIGYAGLKDKHATTIQYLSFDARLTGALKNFRHKNIKILERIKDNKTIRMGDLEGNRFVINLYGVDKIKAGKIEKTAYKIQKEGLANYFGYQRFGKSGDSFKEAKEMLAGERFIKDAKVRNFLISIYQSHLFNEWLKERINMSEAGKFRLVNGDVYMDTNAKLFTPKKIPLKDFLAKKVFPTGLLPGRDVFRARSEARKIEQKYDDEFLSYKGQRRVAVVFPKEFRLRLFAKEKKAQVSFTLPKGTYATVFLEAVKGSEISPAS